MNARFFDRQDRNNPYQGALITHSAGFLACLEGARNRPPYFCELEGDNGFNLLLGISSTRGCAQYSAREVGAPYLMAVDPNAEPNVDYMDFLTGNTDTPVPMRFCMPMDRIERIASDFLETGERSTCVDWEEI